MATTKTVTKVLKSQMTQALDSETEKLIRIKHGLTVEEQEALPRQGSGEIRQVLTQLEAQAYMNLQRKDGCVDQDIKNKIISKLKSK